MGIKDILREELENSLRMLKRYEEELSLLPRGSVSKRKIKGNEYYYLVYRDKGKFKSEYKGKELSDEELEKYSQAKASRAKYRNSISKLKKQIRYLEGVLLGKAEI